MTNLPAHLANRPSRGLTQRATQGMGSALPPHISIQGNNFTLIDAAGNELDAGNTIECVIVDIGDTMAKRYMDPDKPWTPDSNDPPLCWSSNGVGPSVEAMQPQAKTCAECPNNVRGSAVSKISGASIKACRDELFAALLIPKYSGMLFRLVVTPGSFKGWGAFVELFKGRGFDMDTVLTQISFVPKVNGVLQFKPLRHNDLETMKLVDAALAEKKTDALVGRLDRPRGLPAPYTQGQQLVARTDAEANQLIANAMQPASSTLPADSAQLAPSEATVPASKPRGRPKKAVEPASEPAFGSAPATAPFMPSAPPATGNSGFGIQQGVAPNPDLQAAIDNMFGPQ